MIYQNILIVSKEIQRPSSEIDLYFQNKSAISPLIYTKTIEVKESIDDSGNVADPLTENEINKALRIVLNYRQARVFIALRNSRMNPIHEKVFVNILRTAGYRSVFASHLFG